MLQLKLLMCRKLACRWPACLLAPRVQWLQCGSRGRCRALWTSVQPTSRCSHHAIPEPSDVKTGLGVPVEGLSIDL